MQVIIHQTHHQITNFESIFNDLKKDLSLKSSKKELHLYPELYLTGYPLQDLCLQNSFIEQYMKYLTDLDKFAQKLPINENMLFLVGGIQYTLHKSELPEKIENVIFKIVPGKKIEAIYTKQLLPNYDIFDEKKYFTPGNSPTVLEFEKKRIGLLICEDMWASHLYKNDPVTQLAELSKKKPMDLIINLSASPFTIKKDFQRKKRAEEISNYLKAPFVYINRVGAEDEILFDGGSFVQNSNETQVNAPLFQESIQKWTLAKFNSNQDSELSDKPLSWESLFSPNLDESARPIKLNKLTDGELEKSIKALIFGLQEYMNKSGFKKALIALSGGVDSSLVLTLARMALPGKDQLEAIYMPSKFSSDLSRELSIDLCKNLQVPLKHLPIKFLHSSVLNSFDSNIREKIEGLTDENIQSRLRGLLLYTRSNQTGAMVINTSNKSELAVGYSTQYGDSVGAISLLGDLYKNEIFQICEYINKKSPNLIPEKIITRPPTAELRENQTDQQSLPPYERLDAILEGILSYRYSLDEMIEKGHSIEEIQKILKLYTKSEYKRFQFCPILKVKTKSFGFGYRNPLTKNSKFYFSS